MGEKDLSMVENRGSVAFPVLGAVDAGGPPAAPRRDGGLSRLAESILGPISVGPDRGRESGPAGQQGYREVHVSPSAHQLARALPEALAANGLDAEQEHVREMSKMLVGTVQSLTGLTMLVASLMMGSERSGFGSEPQGLLDYLRWSRG